MSERIVVSCRMNGEEVARPESRYLDRARALTQHAEALGATLAAWSATTMAFAWDNDSLEEAVQFACKANGPDGAREKTWACAIARGELVPLADDKGDRARGRADLAWGEPLVAAVILARAARAGEVVVEASFEGLDAFVTIGKRLGRDGERRVRGLRIDPHRPWKRDAGADVERMATASFVERFDVRALLARPGVVHVVRADPGHGGSRALAELAEAVAPGPSVLVAPAGTSVEPLGALRRGTARALAARDYPDDAELAPILDAFLGGVGASIEQAAAIVAALLRPRGPAEPPGALLLDDAGDIDAESLEACAQVVAWMASPFHVVVRIDETDQLPAAFAALPLGREVEIGLLDSADAEAFARALTRDALRARSARKIARRAGYSPLAIEEAVAFGLTTGDISWVGDRAALRTAASLAGKPEGADRWIGRRAKATASDERGVLATLALLGGEAPVATVKEVLGLVEPSIAVDGEIAKLRKRRWLVPSLPGWVALPSRTHKDTIADLLDEAPRRALHHAIADVLEQAEGELGCAEAANHAVKGGDGERGARLALRAARAAHSAGMAKSASRLLTLARLADPKCEPLTRQQLLTSLPPPIMPPSAPPSSRVGGPRGPVAAPPSSRSALDEVPTQRLSVPGPPPAPPHARPPPAHDSDYPTILNARAFAAPAVPPRAARSSPSSRCPRGDRAADGARSRPCVRAPSPAACSAGAAVGAGRASDRASRERWQRPPAEAFSASPAPPVDESDAGRLAARGATPPGAARAPPGAASGSAPGDRHEGRECGRASCTPADRHEGRECGRASCTPADRHEGRECGRASCTPADRHEGRECGRASCTPTRRCCCSGGGAAARVGTGDPGRRRADGRSRQVGPRRGGRGGRGPLGGRAPRGGRS